ncbi:MAG: hypothetical protein IT449_04515 [Phycisphaerales bacterium]|nr:hypothetical protein [Phycisphaerales bacterium]
MRESLQALLHEVLDYAGLFPPAKLPLPEALRGYAAYLRGPHAWMLARFVCPASRLGEVDAIYLKLAQADEPVWRFSGLGRGGETARAFLDGFGADLQAAAELHQRLGGRIVMDVLETRLPPAVVAAGAEELRQCIQSAATAWSEFSAAPARPSSSLFLEVPFSADWRREAANVILQASAVRKTHPMLALKIRTGGVEAHQIPAVEQVAFFIAACRDAGVPFKATAGLHHPLRHNSREIGAKMHGFLNVFAAAALAHSANLAELEIAALLEREDSRDFSVTAEAMRWGRQAIGLDDLRAARRHFAISFGSCSLMEPIEDLQSLGLL